MESWASWGRKKGRTNTQLSAEPGSNWGPCDQSEGRDPTNRANHATPSISITVEEISLMQRVSLMFNRTTAPILAWKFRHLDAIFVMNGSKLVDWIEQTLNGWTWKTFLATLLCFHKDGKNWTKNLTFLLYLLLSMLRQPVFFYVVVIDLDYWGRVYFTFKDNGLVNNPHG